MIDRRPSVAYGEAEDTKTDVGLRRYMLRVYSLMSLGLALTGLVSLFVLSSPSLFGVVVNPPMNFVLFGGILLMGFMAPRLIFSGNISTAHMAFWSYCALWGLLVAPMLSIYTSESIVRVFFITAAAFAGTSLYGYTTKKDLRPMGSFLCMATIGLLVAVIVNIFLQSAMFHFFLSIIIVLVFAGLTAFETQSIRQAYHQGDSSLTAESKAIFGAFMLYGSFVTMFIWLLAIFGQRR